MELDYKGRKFSFSKQKRERKRKIIFSFSLFLVLAIVALLLVSSSDEKKIRKVESLLLQNRINKACAAFDKIKTSPFHRNAKRELKGLIALFNNEIEKSETIFSKIKIKDSSLSFKKYLTFFSDNAKYRQLKIYSDFLNRIGGNNPEIFEYRAIAATALFLPDISEKILNNSVLKGVGKDSPRVKKIRKINNMIKSGRINFVYDSNKEPVAYYDVKRARAVSLINGFSFDDFGKLLKSGLQFFTVTIDKEIHLKIDRLFSGKNGSFILIDLDDGSIITAYSKPFNMEIKNSVFSEEFEPGSVIKSITLFGYLDSLVKNIFPFTCSGNTVIDGKLFYDWIKHGRLKNEVEALSRSCNLAFSKMGLLLGREKLGKYLKLFYFNAPPLNDLFLKFHMGYFNDKTETDYSLANLSIGLEEIKETTFHIAFVNSIIASDGIAALPFLITNRKNVLGVGNYYHKSSVIEVLKNNRAYSRVRFSMNQVIEDKKGTGRRAKTDNIRFAIKTGTAGKKKDGFDSVISGFFPYGDPKYAFALRLERAGKAELAGARFVKKFLEDFYGK